MCKVAQRKRKKKDFRRGDLKFHMKYILIHISCFVSIHILEVRLKIHNSFRALETGNQVCFLEHKNEKY